MQVRVVGVIAMGLITRNHHGTTQTLQIPADFLNLVKDVKKRFMVAATRSKLAEGNFRSGCLTNPIAVGNEVNWGSARVSHDVAKAAVAGSTSRLCIAPE